MLRERASAVKSINALRRGLDVLMAIEGASAITFSELHRQTGLPKATLLRVLKTLLESRRISYNETQRRYVPASYGGVDSDAALERWDALVEIAAPVCQALQRQVHWPVDLAVRDGQAMLVLDALRSPNGFAVNYRALGFRPPMLLSSLGRCYLAFCPAAERAQILAGFAHSSNEVDIQARRPERIQRLLSAAARQGYATRDPSPTEMESPDRFGALSVPVFREQQVAVCISISWLPAVASEQQIVQTHLKDMREAAAALQQRLKSLPRL